jgi:LysM repeat protein
MIHVVEKSDTIRRIAERYGSTVTAIVAANPDLADPDRIRPGQQLVVPNGDGPEVSGLAAKARPKPETKPKPTPATASPPATKTYTIVAGDTLGKVTKALGVSLSDLLVANPQITNPDVIKRGQVLTIPTVSPEPPPRPPRPEDSTSEPPSTRRNWPRVPVDQRMLYVMERLVAAGYPVNGAAGIIGNLYIESGIIPNRLQGSKSRTPMRARDFSGVERDFTPEEIMRRDEKARLGPRLGGIGLAQWTYQARRDRLFAHEYGGRVLGPQILFDMDAQLDYLLTELKRSKHIRRVVAAAAVTTDDAADEILYEFERPASIIAGGKRLPRSHPRVQDVFAERRASAQRALRVWRDAHPR